MKNHEYTIFFAIVILCAIMLVCLTITGCNQTNSSGPSTSASSTTEPTTTVPSKPEGMIDWTLYGTYLTADGEILETMEFTVTGEIIKDPEISDNLQLSISLPDSFRFYIAPSEDFYSLSDNVWDIIPYYISGSICFDAVTKAPERMYFALCEAQEQLIIHFTSDPGKYLVASTDEAVAPGDILQYFHEFIRMYNEESP